MTSINIGEKILIRRKQQGLTQSQLAERIGVSAGAVSKWEHKVTLPDILLIKPLARALGITVDELLDFESALSDEEIAQKKLALTEIILKQGYEAGAEAIQAELQEYPNSIELKLAAATLLQMYLGLSENQSEEAIADRIDSILGLFQQAAAADEVKYSQVALFAIASLEMGRTNYTEAEAALDQLASVYVDPHVLWPELLFRQNKLDLAEQTAKSLLLNQLNRTSSLLITLSKIASERQDFPKAHVYLDALDELEKSFEFGLASADYSRARLFLKQEDVKQAAQWFLTYVKGLLETPSDYADHPYLAGLELQVKSEGQKIVREHMMRELMESSEWDAIRQTTSYKEAIDLLQQTLTDEE